MADLLAVNNVTKAFGGLIAVNAVDFHIAPGMIAGLIGPNGAGKTTLFNNITGLYTPTKGEIVFDGQRVSGLKPHEVQARGIARTFQNIRLFGQMTALENILVGMHSRLKGNIFEAFFRPPRVRHEEAEAAAKALDLLDFVGLGRKFADWPARNLPYGFQRRLEIARALASDPKLLLLDEPSSGLNVEETEDMAFWIEDISRDLGITVIMVEHDMTLVSRVSDRVMAMNQGRVLAMGSAAEVQRHPAVVEAYIGTPAAAGETVERAAS